MRRKGQFIRNMNEQELLRTTAYMFYIFMQQLSKKAKRTEARFSSRGLLDVQTDRRTDGQTKVTQPDKERLWVDVIKQEGKWAGHSI